MLSKSQEALEVSTKHIGHRYAAEQLAVVQLRVAAAALQGAADAV
jgi:hypothetical protein